MPFDSVAALLLQHRANSDLNATVIPASARSAQDLAADATAGPLDERIIEATGEALDAGHTHYEPVPGIDPLRAALAQHLSEATAADWRAGNVLVTAGMQEARFLTLQLIDAQGAALAVPEVVHPGVRKALGVRPRATHALAVDAERRLPQLDAMRAALEAGCRLLYLESPSRLSGATFNAEELAMLAVLLEQHNANLILDRGLAPWVGGPGAAAITERVALIGEAFLRRRYGQLAGRLPSPCRKTGCRRFSHRSRSCRSARPRPRNSARWKRPTSTRRSIPRGCNI